MSNKARHKPFTVVRSDKMIRNEDLLTQVTRSIHADIGKENALNNSIATQQNYLLIHQETDTRKKYDDRGMQSEESYGPFEKFTIRPQSSADCNETEDESCLDPTSIVLAPKNSKNNTKTPEAGDKTTPQVEKVGDVSSQIPAKVTSLALVPFKEDTLWILLHARSKLLTYLEEGEATKEIDEAKRKKPENEALKNQVVDDIKLDTYKNMQSDIKNMITDLLLQSSEIKGGALSAGIVEDDSPPLICDFLDSYYSTASADVTHILDCILERVDEKIKKPAGIGDADDIKSTLRSFLIPMGQKNVTETYFCTTTFDKIPKTSWIFGDTSKESNVVTNKPDKSTVDDDILFQSLEGCCDLISGLFDPKEQFVCMMHNDNMRKSEKGIDLRTHTSHKPKVSSDSATEEETIVRNTYLSSSSSSLSQSTKTIIKKVPIQVSSSSDDSLVKSRLVSSNQAKKAIYVKEVDELSGYDSDVEDKDVAEENENVNRTRAKKIKSRQEMNSPEEVRKIEENVEQNKRLKGNIEEITDVQSTSKK